MKTSEIKFESKVKQNIDNFVKKHFKKTENLPEKSGKSGKSDEFTDLELEQAIEQSLKEQAAEQERLMQEIQNTQKQIQNPKPVKNTLHKPAKHSSSLLFSRRISWEKRKAMYMDKNHDSSKKTPLNVIDLDADFWNATDLDNHHVPLVDVDELISSSQSTINHSPPSLTCISSNAPPQFIPSITSSYPSRCTTRTIRASPLQFIPPIGNNNQTPFSTMTIANSIRSSNNMAINDSFSSRTRLSELQNNTCSSAVPSAQHVQNQLQDPSNHLDKSLLEFQEIQQKFKDGQDIGTLAGYFKQFDTERRPRKSNVSAENPKPNIKPRKFGWNKNKFKMVRKSSILQDAIDNTIQKIESDRSTSSSHYNYYKSEPSFDDSIEYWEGMHGIRKMY